MPKCGARTRSGKPCGQPAMANGRCRLHGGKTPRGIASPHFKHGRYSKDLPTRLLARYKEAMEDPDLLALRSEIALLDARVEDLLRRVDTRESGKLWTDLKKAYDSYLTATQSRDVETMAQALNEVEKLIRRGYSDFAIWQEVMDLLDRRRRLVESERKRLVEMQQMITAERAMVLISAIVDTIRKHVDDRTTLTAISNDIRLIIDSQAS